MSLVLSPRESLASILTVKRLREGKFVACLEDFWGAALGCDVLARTALAAADTCEGKGLHSLHACFLRPIPPQVPLTLRVERLTDCSRFARRRIQVYLQDQLLCEATASFVAEGAGLTYQGVGRDLDIAAPEDLPSTLECARAEGWAEYAGGPIEFRRLGPPWPWPAASPTQSSIHREWVYPKEPLPDNPRLQMAALVFLSDFYAHWTGSDRLGVHFVPSRFTSLDHALWIHHPPHWDDWWLLKAVTDVGAAGRTLTRREIYTRDGVLVASTTQEGFYTGAGVEAS
jgi:acyl-CoA thioesterase-2